MATWKTLADAGTEAPLVLAVDFDITGRPEARFSDLVANMGVDLRVWETVPPPAGTPDSAYVDHWAGQLEETRPQVHALMGFCAGSVYAAALAERAASWQERPPLLVLFDPELSTSDTLLWQFEKITGYMSPMLPEEQIAEARRIGRQAYEEAGDVSTLRDRLIELLGEYGHPALAKLGLDQRRRDELFDAFRTFIDYLAAAGSIDPLRQWREAVAFNSGTPLSGLDAMRAAEMNVIVAKELDFDVDHGAMLADPRLAAAVADLLKA
uniref:PyrG2 n=1 Tax=Streptomyces rugosporus TaxID=295838 RepID=K7QRJ3_STRRG|nr:PyrG2 [Streptomyces rugosporus]